MSINSFVKHVLVDILTWRTNLSEKYMHTIAENFGERMGVSRHTVVPTYLTDEMFEAVRAVHPEVDFKTANSIYVNAVGEYSRHDRLPLNPDQPGSFW